MKKILVIEDDLALQKAYKGMFMSGDYELLQAYDGEKGVQMAEQQKPDVILLDIMMPKMNGIEVLKKLKTIEETKNIDVIVLSNLSGPQINDEIKAIGAVNYLVKSDTDPTKIEAVVKEVIDRQNSTP